MRGARIVLAGLVMLGASARAQAEPAPVLWPHVEAELGAGVWLPENASHLRIPLASPSATLVILPGRERLRIDARYRIAFDKEGSAQLGYAGTLQALEARVHARFPLGRVALTLGGGPSLSLETGSFHFSGTEQRVPSTLRYGASVAGGVDVLVGRVPLHVEVGAASRNERVDLLGSVALALPWRS